LNTFIFNAVYRCGIEIGSLMHAFTSIRYLKIPFLRSQKTLNIYCNNRSVSITLVSRRNGTLSSESYKRPTICT